MFKITKSKEEEKVIPDIEIVPVFEEIDYEQIRKDAEESAIKTAVTKKIEDELRIYVYGREVFEATIVAMKDSLAEVDTLKGRKEHPKANIMTTSGGYPMFGFDTNMYKLYGKLTQDFLETIKD